MSTLYAITTALGISVGLLFGPFSPPSPRVPAMSPKQTVSPERRISA